MAAPTMPDGTGRRPPDDRTMDWPIDAGGTARDRERMLRREVGPTARAVLTDLCHDGRSDDRGVLVVAASARRVAANVGIGKDAAARALRRLIGAGVLRRLPQCSDAAGRFGPCICELHVAHALTWPLRPTDGDTVDHPGAGVADPANNLASASLESDTDAPRGASRRRGRPLAGSLGDQLSLLDAAPDTRTASNSGGAS